MIRSNRVPFACYYKMYISNITMKVLCYCGKKPARLSSCLGGMWSDSGPNSDLYTAYAADIDRNKMRIPKERQQRAHLTIVAVKVVAAAAAAVQRSSPQSTGNETCFDCNPKHSVVKSE